HKLSTKAGTQREYKADADEPHRTYYARSSVASEIGRVALSRLTNGTLFAYASGSIGTGAFYAFNNFVLPPILKSFGAPDLLIGLLSSTRSIEGAVIQPTVGALSDRVWTRFGRRAPFVLVGIPLSAVFFISAAFVNTLWALALTIVLFSIFFNLAVDPYSALL